MPAWTPLDESQAAAGRGAAEPRAVALPAEVEALHAAEFPAWLAGSYAAGFLAEAVHPGASAAEDGPEFQAAAGLRDAAAPQADSVAG